MASERYVNLRHVTEIIIDNDKVWIHLITKEYLTFDFDVKKQANLFVQIIIDTKNDTIINLSSIYRHIRDNIIE